MFNQWQLLSQYYSAKPYSSSRRAAFFVGSWVLFEKRHNPHHQNSDLKTGTCFNSQIDQAIFKYSNVYKHRSNKDLISIYLLLLFIQKNINILDWDGVKTLIGDIL